MYVGCCIQSPLQWFLWMSHWAHKSDARHYKEQLKRRLIAVLFDVSWFVLQSEGKSLLKKDKFPMNAQISQKTNDIMSQ